MSFAIHAEGVATLARLMNVKQPVTVRKVQFRKSAYWGRYVAFRDGRHRITIDSRLHPADALSTLLHELQHAHQCEALGCDDKAFFRRWWAEMRAIGVTRSNMRSPEALAVYPSTPLERDASATATCCMASAESVTARAITLPQADLDRLYAKA